jgi:hypothetical protein
MDHGGSIFESTSGQGNEGATAEGSGRVGTRKEDGFGGYGSGSASSSGEKKRVDNPDCSVVRPALEPLFPTVRARGVELFADQLAPMRRGHPVHAVSFDHVVRRAR